MLITIIVLAVVAFVVFVGYLERANLAANLKSGIASAVTVIEAEAAKAEVGAKADFSSVVAYLKAKL